MNRHEADTPDEAIVFSARDDDSDTSDSSVTSGLWRLLDKPEGFGIWVDHASTGTAPSLYLSELSQKYLGQSENAIKGAIARMYSCAEAIFALLTEKSNNPHRAQLCADFAPAAFRWWEAQVASNVPTLNDNMSGYTRNFLKYLDIDTRYKANIDVLNIIDKSCDNQFTQPGAKDTLARLLSNLHCDRWEVEPDEFGRLAVSIHAASCRVEWLLSTQDAEWPLIDVLEYRTFWREGKELMSIIRYSSPQDLLLKFNELV